MGYRQTSACRQLNGAGNRPPTCPTHRRDLGRKPRLEHPEWQYAPAARSHARSSRRSSAEPRTGDPHPPPAVNGGRWFGSDPGSHANGSSYAYLSLAIAPRCFIGAASGATICRFRAPPVLCCACVAPDNAAELVGSLRHQPRSDRFAQLIAVAMTFDEVVDSSILVRAHQMSRTVRTETLVVGGAVLLRGNDWGNAGMPRQLRSQPRWCGFRSRATEDGHTAQTRRRLPLAPPRGASMDVLDIGTQGSIGPVTNRAASPMTGAVQQTVQQARHVTST